jgi:hypothetical protein
VWSKTDSSTRADIKQSEQGILSAKLNERGDWASMADQLLNESDKEGRDQYFMDIDRMINEGLGGGMVTINNGLIEETSVDTMQDEDQ